MKSKFWKWVGIIAASVIVAVSVLLYQITFTGANIYPNTKKRHAMIRLEDIGPGGVYGSLEGLGKLRAVMEYIQTKDIPYHMAVIPRWISVEVDGTWRERGIDDPNPDTVVSNFIRLLQEGEKRGAILGMHGYSHQFGDSTKPNDNQNSGIGNEFKVNGAPETKESSYAAERITKSIAAFDQVGLQPKFWETPHYHDTRVQEKVFRSFIGILYQPDLFSLRSLKDINVYDTTNSYGQSSLGSIYVPAPYSYVKDEKSVDRILAKAANDDGLASLYFHPFLEFPYLEEQLGADGKQLIRDGLPVFKYKDDGPRSNLHRLLDGFEKEGYRWMSLHDIVPYTPAHRVTMPPSTSPQKVLLGDVTGHGHADVIVVEKHRVLVIPQSYKLPRNRPQHASQVWLKHTFTDEEELILSDWNSDGKRDLISYNKKTGELRIFFAGEGQFLAPILLGKLPSGLQSLEEIQSEKGKGMIATQKGHIKLIHLVNNKLVLSTVQSPFPKDSNLYIGRFESSYQNDILCVSSKDQQVSIRYYQGNGQYTKSKPIKGISLNPRDQLLVGDPNGDGKSDLIVYNSETGVWQVYENKGNSRFVPLDNSFGPWAHGSGRIGFVADFDGNGKTDIGSYDYTGQLLDIALSFRK
ncbi:DUF2334 domain-containing protein [Rummeliibacillus sp. NPDC094406]|uniref:DUF2334 domain-containing protein n=1 Tax=Rummeliibacillus sp. NPDC094406 TaxID=3364511 RepID=UPI003806C082